MTDISVIIPSYNDKDFLFDLVDSLYSVEAGCRFLPVIVNDHSDDGTQDALSDLSKYIQVIVPEHKSYFTRCCNVGLHWARENVKSQFYFLLNSDTRVTPGWGGALIATSLKLDAGIIGAMLLYPDGKVQHAGAYGQGYHFGINNPWVRYYQDRIVPWVTGAAMCIRQDVLNTIGYLPVTRDIRQYDASDREFCREASLIYGFNIAVSSGCVIYHFTHEAERVRKVRGDY